MIKRTGSVQTFHFWLTWPTYDLPTPSHSLSQVNRHSPQFNTNPTIAKRWIANPNNRFLRKHWTRHHFSQKNWIPISNQKQHEVKIKIKNPIRQTSEDETKTQEKEIKTTEKWVYFVGEKEKWVLKRPRAGPSRERETEQRTLKTLAFRGGLEAREELKAAFLHVMSTDPTAIFASLSSPKTFECFPISLPASGLFYRWRTRYQMPVQKRKYRANEKTEFKAGHLKVVGPTLQIGKLRVLNWFGVCN